MVDDNQQLRRFMPWLTDKGRDCSTEFAEDVDGCQVSSSLDRLGRELPDSTPTAPPVGMSSGPSLADFVQRMIRQEVSRQASLQEMESFEEAEDFDIEDDPLDPETEYEKTFDKAIPKEWPMYYNPQTGFYGQLPPGTAPPEGFVALEREKRLPEGFVLPEPREARGEGGAEPPTDQARRKPPGRPKTARVLKEEPQDTSE